MQERSMSSELTIDELDAVSGGAEKTPFQAVYEGLVKGFVEAGGKVTCEFDGHGGVALTFKP
jgi:bacteriocin-like protein